MITTGRISFYFDLFFHFYPAAIRIVNFPKKERGLNNDTIPISVFNNIIISKADFSIYLYDRKIFQDKEFEVFKFLICACANGKEQGDDQKYVFHRFNFYLSALDLYLLL